MRKFTIYFEIAAVFNSLNFTHIGLSVLRLRRRRVQSAEARPGRHGDGRAHRHRRAADRAQAGRRVPRRLRQQRQRQLSQ